MRSKRALGNMLMNVMKEIIFVLSGFILPRLILSAFGSDYNGIVSSITQFISWAALLQGVIVMPARAALYKPLADKDIRAISEVVLAIQLFMRKIAFVFLGLLIVLAVLYPFSVKEDFEWYFSATLVLIIGLGTAVQCFVGITYQALVIADQRQYLVSGINIVTTLFNTALTIILINSGVGIHLVKLVSVLTLTGNPVFIYIYSKKHYKFIKNIKPNFEAISQRWDALNQHIAGFINDNTDIVIITLFTNVFEVSVYTVYYLALNGIRGIIYNLIGSFDSFFGDMIAKKEHDLLDNNFKLFELISFSLSSVFFSVATIQLTPFVSLYTKGVTDINYYRPIFGYIACFAVMIRCLQLPYASVVFAAGRFKETKIGATLEAIINIVFTLVFINFLGIIGAVIGTLIAVLFRMFNYSLYSYRHIIKRNYFFFFKRLLSALISVGIIFAVPYFIMLEYPDNAVSWVINSIVYTVIALVITFTVNFIFYKDEMEMLYKKVVNIFRKRKA